MKKLMFVAIGWHSERYYAQSELWRHALKVFGCRCSNIFAYMCKACAGCCSTSEKLESTRLISYKLNMSR